MKPKLKKKIVESAIEATLLLAALSSIFITLSIVIVLSYESFGFFSNIPLIEFFTGTEWTPLFAEPKFGILPLVAGTLLTTIYSIIGSAAVRSDSSHLFKRICAT